MRKFVSDTGMSALMFSFLNIGIAAAIMVLLTPVLVLTPVTLDPWIVVSILLLGCLGTGVAYIWNQNTVRAWGPTRASTVTYITPLVGVLLGVIVLGEHLSWNEPVGALIVFLGILLAQNRLRRRARPRRTTTDSRCRASAVFGHRVGPSRTNVKGGGAEHPPPPRFVASSGSGAQPTAMRSMTKISVLPQRKWPPAGPYASSGGMTSSRRPPTFMPGMPSCQPWIRPRSGNWMLSPRFHDESNSSPDSYSTPA